MSGLRQVATMSWSNNEGDSAQEVIALHSDDGWTLEEVQLYAEDEWQPTRCMHSYDCCGRWYQPGKVTVSRPSEYENVFLVYRSTIRNV